MSGLDLSGLTPQDAQAALRSYPRRFRALLRPIGDDDQGEELAHRLGPGGRSALEIASDVTRTWVLLAEALRQVAVSDTPMLHPAVTDASLRSWDMAPPEAVEDTLVLLGLEADALADAVADLPIDDWTRTGSVAGGTSVSAIDLVRDAVRTGHGGLADLERTIAALRR